MSQFSRRDFILAASIAAIGTPLLRAVEPFTRNGGPRLRMALAAYSFRDFFEHSTAKQEQVSGARSLTIEGFIDQCAEWYVDGAELTSYYFPPDVTAEQLLAIRRHAYLAGVSITGTSVGNTFTHPPGEERDKQTAYVKQWIDHAATLGAPHIRVFAGNVPKGSTAEAAKENCITQLEECAEYAGDRGIFLGIENHGGIVAKADDLLDIIHAVKSPWVGINLDSGNFHSDDPYADLARCAPFAVNVQIKTEMRPAGAKENEPADFDRIADILEKANYRGWVALEFEEKTDPYTRVPIVLGQLRKALALGSPGEKGKAGEAGWTPLFDGKALGDWKETDYAGKGEVEVKDGQLILHAGGDMTGVNLAKAPATTDYEVEFDAMRVEGDDFFVGFTFPVGKTHVSFIAGGWAGSVTGISNIDGNAAIENETTQFKKYDNGKWYHIRVKVTADKLEAWIDKEQMVNLELENKNLEVRAGEIEIAKPFGFTTYKTKGAYKNIRWRKVAPADQ